MSKKKVACKGQKRVWIALKIELLVLLCHQTWVVGTELRIYVRIINVLNH